MAELGGGRTVTVVLTDPSGVVLGSLPEVELAQPWWPETGDLVDAVRTVFGIEIVVLRLLGPNRGSPQGGNLTVLAETAGAVPAAARPCDVELDEHPLRASWARSGGPAEHVAWACEVLRDQGIALLGQPLQRKSWNLSTIWRFETDVGPLWLKVLPPFLGPEGALLGWLGHSQTAMRTPRLVASDGPRVLMGHLRGRPVWLADEVAIRRVIDSFVALQASTVGRDAELLELGVFDLRAPRFAQRAATLLQRRGNSLEPTEREALEVLIETLPQRFVELAGCGLPMTLVHGDFSPVNMLLGEDHVVAVFDWGEAAIGHPMLDAGMLGQPAPQHALVRRWWQSAWLRHYPSSDPARAARLIEPLRHLRIALTYQSFLDGIETSERVYHASDVPEQLSAAVAAARLG